MRYAGAFRKENVGMSNDKIGESPIRRKTKDSNSMQDRVGLVGT